MDDPYGRVVALTAYPDKAVEWGVDETRVLPFPESVGGRYSLWSSIGFPVALALGWDEFAEFLDGAAAMDQHFLESDGAANLPLRAAFAEMEILTLTSYEAEISEGVGHNGRSALIDLVAHKRG